MPPIENEIVIPSYLDANQKLEIRRNADFLEWSFFGKTPAKAGSKWHRRRTVSVAIEDLFPFIGFLRYHIKHWLGPGCDGEYILVGFKEEISCRILTLDEPHFVLRTPGPKPDDINCRVDLRGSDLQKAIKYLSSMKVLGSDAADQPIFGLGG